MKIVKHSHIYLISNNLISMWWVEELMIASVLSHPLVSHFLFLCVTFLRTAVPFISPCLHLRGVTVGKTVTVASAIYHTEQIRTLVHQLPHSFFHVVLVFSTKILFPQCTEPGYFGGRTPRPPRGWVTFGSSRPGSFSLQPKPHDKDEAAVTDHLPYLYFA